MAKKNTKNTSAKNKAKSNVTKDVQAPVGEEAAYNGLGQGALEAGEYVAGRYVPAPQQIDTGRAFETQNSLNGLNANIANSEDTNRALALQNQYSIRSREQQDILDRQNDIAKNGMDSREFQGLRDQMNQGIGSAFRTGQSQLAKAQARGRVYGAAAAAQQGNLINATNSAKLNNEQQLYIKGQEVRRTGLQDYSNTLNAQNQMLSTNANAYGQSARDAQQGIQARGMAANQAMMAAQQSEIDRQKFNIGEADAATAARLGAITNTAGLVNANQLNAQQLGLQRDAIAAAGGRTNNMDKAISGNKKQSAKSVAKKKK